MWKEELFLYRYRIESRHPVASSNLTDTPIPSLIQLKGAPLLNSVKYGAPRVTYCGSGCMGPRFPISAGTRGEWSASRSCRFYPRGKELPVPTVNEVGWTPKPVWTIWRSPTFVNLGTRTSNLPVVQQVDSHCTDCATAYGEGSMFKICRSHCSSRKGWTSLAYR
jgi:hypothetical protein